MRSKSPLELLSESPPISAIYEPKIQKPPKFGKWLIVSNAIAWLTIAALVVWSTQLYVAGERLKAQKPEKVIGMMAAVPIKLTPNTYTASVMGEKVQACEYLDETVGWSLNGSMWRETGFRYIADQTPGSTRPPGSQNFGLWQWDINGNDSMVRTTVCHDCQGRRICTIVGPFQIQKPAESSQPHWAKSSIFLADP